MARPFLPCFLHYGDALAEFWRRPQHVADTLDRIADAGYQGVRAWTVLTGDFWAGRDVGPWLSIYDDVLLNFQRVLRERGLQWLVSQGDLWQLDASGREATRAALLRTLDRNVVAGIDGANEPQNNGGARPQDIRAWLDPFIRAWPGLVWSLGSPVSEDVGDLDDFSGVVFDVHGFRGDHWWDKLRHIFTLTYKGERPPPRCRLGVQSEGFGPGPFVSGVRNQHELTGDVMAAAAVLSTLARQWWVYFPGFEKGTGDVAQAGFTETPKALALLPRDVMTYQHLVHGGPSQSRRVFEVTDASGAKTMRCDHAISDSGAFVCLAYGPNLQDHRQVRGTVDVRHQFGNAAILYIGRL